MSTSLQPAAKPPVSRHSDGLGYKPTQRRPRMHALLLELEGIEDALLQRAMELLQSDYIDDECPRASASQARRLLRLAEYLMMLPDDYHQFEMSHYSNKDEYAGRKPVSCGSTACALGHAPYALGHPRQIVQKRFNPLGGLEDWDDYGERVFGSLSTQAEGFLFGGEWSRDDNTTVGAAARILTLLDLAVKAGQNPDESQGQLAIRSLCRRGFSQAIQDYTPLKAVLEASPTMSEIDWLDKRLEPDPELCSDLRKPEK